MRHRPRTLPLLLLLALSSCTVAPPPPTVSTIALQMAAAEPPENGALPFDPQLRRERLANGLQTFVRHNGRPAGRAELWLVVDAGSVLEDDDQRGLAHFVEHMAFNGTERFPKQAIVDALESLGMRFGPDINASTSFDETIYTLTVPTDDPSHLELGLDILAEWASGVTFDPQQVDAERGVVIEEWRQGLGAASRLRDRHLPVLLQGSRYASRLPIGDPTVIEHAPVAALKRFYDDWYRPDLMAVIAVGDFDVDAVSEAIEVRFAPLPEAANRRQRIEPEVPDHSETLTSVASDPEATGRALSLYSKRRPTESGTVGAYRKGLVEGLYHSLLNERLAEVGRRDAPFVAAFSSAGSLVRTAEVVQQVARAHVGREEEALRALLREVVRVGRYGFGEDELARAKAELLRGYERAALEADKQPSGALASEYSRVFLIGEGAPGIVAELALVGQLLPGITQQEVHAAVPSWNDAANRVLLSSAPDDPEHPPMSGRELLAILDEVGGEALDQWLDRTRDEPLLAAPPAPGAVIGEHRIPELEVTEWRLSNGARVILRPTDFRNDQVLISGFSPGGTSLASDGDHLSATFADSLLAIGGLGAFDQTELGKALSGKMAAASAYVGELEEGIAATAAPADLETALQLVHQLFVAPRRDDEAVATFLSRTRSALENRLLSPDAVFTDALSEVVSQGHPRRRPLTPERLAEVELDVAERFYRERFADASDFTFLIVGNLDLAALRPLVERYLASLPALNRAEEWRDIGVEPPLGIERVTVRRGLEQRAEVQLLSFGDEPWSRVSALELATLGQALRIRLREVLREELGATYGVAVSGSLSRRPRQRWTLSVGFGCAPDSAEELVGQMLAELRRVAAEGIDPVTLEKVQAAQLRQREVDLRENGFWLGALKSAYAEGLDPRQILGYEERVRAITPERMRAAADRYLTLDRYVLGVLLPEEEASGRRGG